VVDTVRTLSALQTLLADNTSGDISPQDIRDFLVSVSPPHGTMYRNVAAATTTVTPGTYLKAAGTTTAGNLNAFDMPANNRLRYTGAAQKHFHIAVSVSFTCGANNKTVGLKIAKDGVVMDDSVARRRVGTGTDIGSTALHADTTLTTNQYLELWLTNETNTATVTIDEMYFFVMGMLA
jgi:hypothetical protein